MKYKYQTIIDTNIAIKLLIERIEGELAKVMAVLKLMKVFTLCQALVDFPYLQTG